MRLFCVVAALLVLAEPSVCASSIPIFSDGFEEGLKTWDALWTREDGVGRLSVVSEDARHGVSCVRIEHSGTRDWSFHPETPIAVKAGELFHLTCWARVKGGGNVTLCVTTRDENERVIEWIFAARTTAETGGWKRLESRFAVPAEVSLILPRLIGSGEAVIWVDDFKLVKEGNVADLGAGKGEEVVLQNRHLEVRVEPATGALTVRDKRTGRSWRQRVSSSDVLVQDIRKRGNGACLSLLHVSTGIRIRAAWSLSADEPEVKLALTARGELTGSLRYPHPFLSEEGSRVILPMNEGISYPVEDETIESAWYHTYGGHGLCMPFFGTDAGGQGWMAIIETADDAAVRMFRLGGNLSVAPEWQGQKGKFGYERRLRYCFFDGGGYVAMCKRYRRHARETGLFKTLEEKRSEIPAVDLLVGAVNVWTWESDELEIVKEMQGLGIDRILWSHRAAPETVRAMNEMGGILTSRYDIYQDVMDPARIEEGIFPWLHPDWTQDGWPHDLMIGAGGSWVRGWEVTAKDGKRYPCGTLCDKVAPAYARKRIKAELATHSYRSRFIDTTTASSWRECYDRKHPQTRTQSKRWKMKLLEVVSGEFGLVCGSETGHDAAVPFVHYFEGMLSLGPYRVPEAGRDMGKILDRVPERVAKFQTGESYRLPLWELVYHDCVVAQWYWGDYNNKLPALWDKRDLFNVLYGTPPMFMFDRELWAKNKLRFAKSYRDVCAVARKVGFSEMTNHRVLDAERRVQETEFANGVTVTVNFSDKPHSHPGGFTVPPSGFRVREKKDE